jgi:hypothetical protein
MSKQSKKQSADSPSQILCFLKKRKVLTVLGCVGIVVALTSFAKYNVYKTRFSDKDYAAISAAAERTFRAIGAQNIAKDESCRYRAPEKFASNKLFCGVEVAAYLPYVSDEQAVIIAKNLEEEIQKLGQVSSYFSDFYANPENSYTGATVNLTKPLPEEQCNFIALSFECSAESREEYFPVTYRQG